MTNKIISSALTLALVASSAAAQSTTGPRWSAFVGCWQQAAVEGQEITGTAKVCVVPVGSEGADLVTVTDAKAVERTHLVADGAHRDVARQGCTGWESSRWSADGKRLFLSSEQQCNGLQRTSSGLFALAANGQLTNVVNVDAGGGHALRVLRYSPASVDSTFPADVVAAVGRSDMSFEAARISAEARLYITDVVEASKTLNASVVQAWLAASGRVFDLDAKTLIRLADDGVPPATIDVMVALSNPSVFAVMPQATGVSATENPQPVRARTATQDCYSAMMDPYGYVDYRYCDAYYRSRFYPYGYMYGYGYDPFYYNYNYGRSFYGYSGGYGYGYGGPVVVVVKGSANDPQAKHGRMTKDGYTTGGSSTSGTSYEGTRDSRPASSSSGSSSSGSSGSSSGSSGSSGGSSSGRTAHTKPPATYSISSPTNAGSYDGTRLRPPTASGSMSVGSVGSVSQPVTTAPSTTEASASSSGRTAHTKPPTE